MLKANSQYTKTGFSKSGFAACGHWQFCSLGKNTCYYSEIDPEVKEYCQCYKRHRTKQTVVETKENEELNFSNKKHEKQLSLF